MKGLLFFVAVLFSYIYSCKNLNHFHKEPRQTLENEIIRKSGVHINLYGAPWEVRYTAMYNLSKEWGDSIIIVKCKEINDKDSCEFKRIKFNKLEIDSFYDFIIKIKNNFRLNDINTGVSDGTKVRISISAESNALTYVYASQKDAESADPEIGKLIKFINKRLPKDFQMF